MIKKLLRLMQNKVPARMILPLLAIDISLSKMKRLARGCYLLCDIPVIPRNVYILMYPGFGDVCYTAAYLKAFRLLHKEMRVVLIVTKYSSQILKFYDRNYDDLYYVEHDDAEKMIEAYYILKQYNIMDREDVVCSEQNSKDYRLFGYFGINALSMTRDIVFHLPIFEKPVMPNELDEAYRAKIFINVDNAVIINPYSNSLGDISIEFWEKLANELISVGYRVYTNVFGEQKSIDGTLELRCDICDFFYYANKVKYIISVRSGILDLVVSRPCKFIVLYGSNEWIKGHPLSAWGCNPYVYEQYGEPDVEKIMEYIEQTKEL